MAVVISVESDFKTCSESLHSKAQFKSLENRTKHHPRLLASQNCALLGRLAAGGGPAPLRTQFQRTTALWSHFFARVTRESVTRLSLSVVLTRVKS